jgi:hypothetical protein
MSKEDWERFEQITGSLKVVLESDLEHLRRMDEVKRIGIWNQIEHNQSIFEEEFARRLPRDIMMHSKSEFSFAKLLLAAAAHINNEKNSITESFSEKELALVKNYEKFNVFDILSTDEIVERIHRRGDIYQIVREFYEGQYSDLDRLLDDPEIEKGLRYAFKNYYEKRFDKIRKAVQAYAGKYGPIMVVNQIEQKVWEDIKKSEEERKNISESLRRQIADVASRFKSLDAVEKERGIFDNKLGDVERQAVVGKSEVSLRTLESEKDRLAHSYLGFEGEITDLIEATERKQRELVTREAELERARQEYKQQMQEEKRRLVESELKEIDALKNKLDSERWNLQQGKDALQLKRQELDDRLHQITEALGGNPIRLITKEDAKLCEHNFIARFDAKMQDFPLKIHSPLENKTHEIRSWNEDSHIRSTEGGALNTPANARSRYIISERKYGFFGERITKVIIEAMSLNHLREFEGYGFDARRANLSEFLTLMSRFIDNAEIGKYLHVIGIASPTGWDERVLKEIGSTEFAHNYISRYISICLVDSTTGELVYNPADERITKFVDFFRPQFDRERVERINNNILRRLSEIDHVVFEEVLKDTKEERVLVIKAFHDMAKDKMYRLRYIKDVGLVLERVKQEDS